MYNIHIFLLLFCSFSLTAQTAGTSYLDDVKLLMTQQWQGNRTVNFVFHGHSVPSGYFVTPDVRTLQAYPHQVLEKLKRHYPYAVINCIVTAIGGENSEQGCQRFVNEVLTHRPDVLFIDYALNDRGIGLEKAKKAWKTMIETALAKGIKVILLTPTPDKSVNILDSTTSLAQHAEQIRDLSRQYRTGLVDSYETFRQLAAAGVDIENYMSQINHPNEKGHQVVSDLIMGYCTQN
ncbi:MAG: SGNH/GDSL hydrolase family protein [Bacteroidales bacterium]|jgi:lysophospholipase L1-like esterase|nr:SGNH/GDSL hydrolase family protein [Bacteroidales bacterium]